MHIEYKSMNNITVYLFDKTKIEDIDIIKKNPESFFKKIFLILKNKYRFKLEGLYKVDLIPCNNYGMIIDIEKEEDEFYEKYIDGIDLKIKINDSSDVLFELDDIFLLKNQENVTIFMKKNKFYALYTEEINEKELYKILEHSKIIYGKECLDIINPYNLFVFK